jgi:ADP-ribose pyrophosphatase
MIVLGSDQLVDVPLAWPVESSTVLAQGKITSYVEDQVRTPDGQLITREYLKHPGAVGVIALDDHDRVALVRPDCWMWKVRAIWRPSSVSWPRR